MKSMPTADLRREIREALSAVVQIAQGLEELYSLISILEVNSDPRYEDSWNAVDLEWALVHRPDLPQA